MSVLVRISHQYQHPLVLYFVAHVAKKAGVGASCVKTDDPSNDKDKGGNNPNASKAKDSKSKDKVNNK